MATLLIVSQDTDIRTLVCNIIVGTGHQSFHAQTIDQLDQDYSNYDFLIIDAAYDLSLDDWEKLKKLKTVTRPELGIIIIDTPLTFQLRQKCERSKIDIVLPFPSDLTVEIPNALSALLNRSSTIS